MFMRHVNLVDCTAFEQRELSVRWRVHCCHVRRPGRTGMGAKVQEVSCLSRSFFVLR